MTTQIIQRRPCDTFAYGERCEHKGDLTGAARWYRYAAEGGWPGAALRLAAVLVRIADERPNFGRDEESLVAEATRWLAKAEHSGDPEWTRLVMAMLDRQQRLAARRTGAM
jgi:TPR repeat protein